MSCPKCGNQKAIQLLVSWQCPNPDCDNYSSSLYKELLEETLSQTGTTIGRLSSSKPNHNNVPKNSSIKAGCIDLRNKSLTIKQIATIFGITQAAVLRHLRRS